jgi:hypothetical protein
LSFCALAATLAAAAAAAVQVRLPRQKRASLELLLTLHDYSNELLKGAHGFGVSVTFYLG